MEKQNRPAALQWINGEFLYKAKRRGKDQLAFNGDKWVQAEVEERNIEEG